MGEFMGEDEVILPAISKEKASKLIGVSPPTLGNWCRKQYLPCEKLGKRIFIEPEVVDIVRDLFQEHGRKWPKHAEWNGTVNVKPAEQKVSIGNVYENLYRKAKDAVKTKNLPLACVLYETLVESLDLSQM